MTNGTGTRVREARTALGMSQSELASRAGLTQPTISGLERGESQTSGSIASIAAALGVSALWLATGRGSREPQIKAREFSRVYRDGETQEEYEIPLLDAKGSCGNGRMHFSDPYETEQKTFVIDARFIRRYSIKPDAVIAFYADGDSMASFIMHGDILVFNIAIDGLKSGEIYVLDTPDGLRVKRIHKRIDGSSRPNHWP
jgi:transcriptional regulator with XRE-family HTH domain